jgi:hypothetical protein
MAVLVRLQAKEENLMRFPGAVRHVHRTLATLLVFSLALGPIAPTLALAEEEGSGAIRGILYEADGDTRLPAARVIAINVADGERFESNLTGSNGAYEIKGLPAGTYDLVIESGGRLFVAENLIDLASGQRVSVKFAVEPRRPANRMIAGMVEPSGTADIVGSQPGAMGGAPGGGNSVLSSPGGIISVVVLSLGAALVLESILDDDDPPASPIVP